MVADAVNGPQERRRAAYEARKADGRYERDKAVKRAESRALRRLARMHQHQYAVLLAQEKEVEGLT